MRKLSRALLLLLCVGIVGAACRQVPPTYGQGYETTQGYQQPDHSYFYYWMMYNVLLSNPQPTYHVYLPPQGYPVTYRPWQPAPRQPTYAIPPTTYRPLAPNSPRSTGGFSSSPTPPPPPPAFTSPRTSGGFSPPRPASAPPSSPRSSGGFSTPRPPSAPTAPRTSGGFSKKGR